MTDSTKPQILHVDDNPDDLGTWQELVDAEGAVEIHVTHPNDVTESDLRRASTILVDYKLEYWPERDAARALSLKPLNGLALLTVLQEQAWAFDRHAPRAFVLYTGAFDEVARELGHQPHTVARANNLEWIVDKGVSPKSRLRQVTELALAVHHLPHPWPKEGHEGEASLRHWLQWTTDVSWAESAWDDILECHPPVHEFAAHTNGVGVLRWMLHKILPYPTFLIDDVQLAARLRVVPDSLRAALSNEGQLHERFREAIYGGELRKFGGRRWWRAGVESVIYDMTADDPGNVEYLHQVLGGIHEGLQLISGSDVFPILDDNYDIIDELAHAEDVVEVVPDDWPPFASTAWTTKRHIEGSPRLQAIVRKGR